MYRQLSLDYFDTDENLEMWSFLGNFCSYKKHLISMISKRIYGLLFAMHIKEYDILGKCKSCWI